jgi:serine/threonine protein kinase/tetratricopeptide (TPR) repeat protein
MTPARLQTIEEIFHSALAQPQDEIGAFLDTACAGDALLRIKVTELLASHRRAGSFIETPAVGFAAKALESAIPDVLIGQRFGHYQLLGRIGAGGMGEVYLATDLTAGRKAAVKLLPSRFTDDAERLKRFAREARAVVALNHPNILTIYEIGEDRSTHYIASELIEGENLRQRLERGPMATEEALDVASQVASALVAAHEAGIVHRDIKPENIMLRPDGYVKVLDFGVAKLAEQELPSTMPAKEAMSLVETQLGSIFGTTRYMSPEQVLGQAVDKRTDIWSLGAVLYELVAGRAPFSGETAGAVMKAILETEPPAFTNHGGKIPAELEQIIQRTLCKKRDERYQSAGELLDALKGARRHMELSTESQSLVASPAWKHGTRSPAAVVLAVLAAALALALPYYWHRKQTTSRVAEKSIAVLPFEDLSESKENASFAAGIQDDLLTSLAKIHDLKVISRTSVIPYQKPGRDSAREIGRALGVANLLEGTVRRTGNRVLVNVQLIDARNDRHLWAEGYDRTVADSIGLQGELAAKIAATLKAALAPEEKERLGADPTTSSEAYVLYLTALGKDHDFDQNDIAAEQLYVRATVIDPSFALAYARASILNSGLAGAGDEFRNRGSKARAQAEEALRLSPTLGEAHMALGLCLFGDKKYTAALKEFETAAATSPNNAEINMYVAFIYRRQNRWRDSLAATERAQSLDPRNVDIAFSAALNHLFVRDWATAGAEFHRTLELEPNHANSKIFLAYLAFLQQGDPVSAEKILRDMGTGAVPTRWDLAMMQRDYARAEKVLGEFRGDYFFRSKGSPKTFFLGRTALARGDRSTAERYFAAAVPAIEEYLRDDPGDANHHTNLGLLYAYMQRKDDAIREGRRAVELEPESQNAYHGAVWAAQLALIYALVGEKEQAITLIERLLSTPGPLANSSDASSNITLADLRLRWEWDSLRSNPRFQKILAGPEPKTIY